MKTNISEPLKAVACKLLEDGNVFALDGLHSHESQKVIAFCLGSISDRLKAMEEYISKEILKEENAITKSNHTGHQAKSRPENR